MNLKGYVLLPRAKQESALWLRQPAVYAKIHLHLYQNVDYTTGEGEFHYSAVREWVPEASESQWHRCLAFLRNSGEIVTAKKKRRIWVKFPAWKAEQDRKTYASQPRQPKQQELPTELDVKNDPYYQRFTEVYPGKYAFTERTEAAWLGAIRRATTAKILDGTEDFADAVESGEKSWTFVSRPENFLRSDGWKTKYKQPAKQRWVDPKIKREADLSNMAGELCRLNDYPDELAAFVKKAKASEVYAEARELADYRIAADEEMRAAALERVGKRDA